MKIKSEKDGTVTIEGVKFDAEGKESSTGKTKLHLFVKEKAQIGGKTLTVSVLGYSKK